MGLRIQELEKTIKMTYTGKLYAKIGRRYCELESIMEDIEKEKESYARQEVINELSNLWYSDGINDEAADVLKERIKELSKQSK